MTNKLSIILAVLILSTLAAGYWYFWPENVAPEIKTQTREIGGLAGANSPGTMADDATVGTVAWTNPDNAKVSDNIYTTTGASPSTYTFSHYLKSTNFGFSIPAGATINGLLVEIERKAGGSDLRDILDTNIQIVKSDGTIGTTNKNSLVAWSTSEAYFSYGANNDLWGETWAYSDINDVDFGVVLAVKGRTLSLEGAWVASVDHIRITVYYTEAPPASQDTVIIKNAIFKNGIIK